MTQNLMMRSSVNNRKDIVTRKSYKREELIRISILKDGVTSLDKNYNKGGRGIYVHPTSIKAGLENNIILKNIKRFKGDINMILENLKKEIR